MSGVAAPLIRASVIEAEWPRRLCGSVYESTGAANPHAPSRKHNEISFERFLGTLKELLSCARFRDSRHFRYLITQRSLLSLPAARTSISCVPGLRMRGRKRFVAPHKVTPRRQKSATMGGSLDA
ncbi:MULTISPECIES: hypothetical protein [Bradyrhizobium]|uniref:hypothetical protein n=1 Tax=Bradyrhizobium centrosematis TaxID=1300039 RepID=UPI0021692DC7|nr:hypothetical protein [Bradyrhizobium centrosematis]MCS3765555.1 hypothetical protein [Bradyrhizobium centrosematis]MCS3778089.1 hypothetical protein [Bradyrhizobium centrosematis]